MNPVLNIDKTSSEQLAFYNCVYINESTANEFRLSQTKYLEIFPRARGISDYPLCFGLRIHSSAKPGTLMLSIFQRNVCQVAVGDSVNVAPAKFDKSSEFISKLLIEVDFLHKNKAFNDKIDSEKIASEFIDQFKDQPFFVGQEFAFKFNKSLPGLKCKIFSIITTKVDSSSITGGTRESKFGYVLGTADISFKKVPNCSLNLVGRAKEVNQTPTQLLNPNWDFSQLGIGGLDNEFGVIFRRAFSSRIFPPEIVDQLGMKHIRGILLYGPPGTGKTLLARQIGRMLNSRQPKIVNGPEILNKFVGESEANIRKLFQEAEDEQTKKGIYSALHLIIFDEIDAICKQRGSSGRSGAGSAVQDTVVNQLLSKIDGINQLNNILIIGMTNRRDLIDSALLRPGRFEIQLEIALPDLNGRHQILNIHTDKLRQHQKLANDIDLDEIAQLTKNFSGAEIEGLVRSATTSAMNRIIKLQNGKIITPEDNNQNHAFENFKIEQADMIRAIQYDIKPAFGANADNENLLHGFVKNGILLWSNLIKVTIENLSLMIDQTRNGELISPVSVLIAGEEGAGKTALAVDMALKSDIPLIRVCSAENMIGMNEFEKCNYINQLFSDLSKSQLSCLIIDNIERIIEYVDIGPRFSNTVLQSLFVLITKKVDPNKKLLIACTTSNYYILKKMKFDRIFTNTIFVPNITNIKQITAVLEHYELLSSEQINKLIPKLKKINVPIKKLLSHCEMALQLKESDQIVDKLATLLNFENDTEPDFML